MKVSLDESEGPEVIDIVVHIGNSWRRVLDAEDEDPDTGEFTPTDLSSYNAVGQIIDSETDEVLAQMISSELKDDGKIPITLRLQDSLKLSVGSAVWGLTLVSKDHPDTDTITIIVGGVDIRERKFIVNP